MFPFSNSAVSPVPLKAMGQKIDFVHEAIAVEF
jgi:hypothetical protein